MPNTVDGSIIGELLLKELPYWQVGVCVVATGDDDMVHVRGEGDHTIASIDCNEYMKESTLPFGDDRMVYDLSTIASKVNAAIKSEHDQL